MVEVGWVAVETGYLVAPVIAKSRQLGNRSDSRVLWESHPGLRASEMLISNEKRGQENYYKVFQ